MNSVPASFPPEAGSFDEQITADRTERKYLLDKARTAPFIRQVDQRLSRYVHGDTQLPGAQFCSTTIYFDTSSRHLFNLASSEAESVKLRAREYYAIDPSMVQLARRPEDMVRFDRVLWFELKHKQGGRVRKRRFGLPKPDVPGFLADGRITPEMIDLQATHYGDKADAVLGEVSQLCQHYGEPFSVDCIVNYRRIAWQDSAGQLRLTLDRDVGFFAAPEDVWTRDFALTAQTLGPPRKVLDKNIIELKSRGDLPPWLQQAFGSDVAEARNFSKFVTASHHVHSVA